MAAEEPKPPSQKSAAKDTSPRPRGRLPAARTMSWLDRGLLLLSRGWQLWLGLLAQVRSQLPQPWQSRLTDTVMTAIFAGLLVLLLVVFTSGSPAPATEPEAPPPEEAPEVPAAADIAPLQNQVAEITGNYAAGMVQTVQADFQGKTLLITLSSQWYSLSRSQQEQLAQDLYDRLGELAFDKLYLQDPEARPLARSPVIGDHMVILQRRSPDIPL